MAANVEIEKSLIENQNAPSVVQVSQEIQRAMQQAVVGIGQSVDVMGDAVTRMSDAIGQFTEVSSKNAKEAMKAISRPKRIVRENGRIAKIELE
jgi:hypothetical protein